jgi:N6-adenosine-specific RNA methylase IME4
MDPMPAVQAGRAQGPEAGADAEGGGGTVNDIDLRCCDVRDLLADVEPGSVALVHADPPWTYAHDGEKSANRLYAGLTCADIAGHMTTAHAAAADDCYLMLWVTFPLLGEWMAAHALMPWNYLTGAAWGKTCGIGVGFHFRGDSEILLVYRKGRPRPLEGSKTNLWLSKRGSHSEKPQVALEAMVRMGAPAGGLVLDPYAGESASLARCCRRLGRRYIGAEIDPDRHARALRRLNGESAKQAAMVGQETLFG